MTVPEGTSSYEAGTYGSGPYGAGVYGVGNATTSGRYWAPTAQHLKDELRNRTAVRDGRVSQESLQRLLDEEATALVAELPQDIEATPEFARAAPMARLHILFRSAARLEDSLHPEQAAQPDSNAQRLTDRAQVERDRLFAALDLPAGGTDTAVRAAPPVGAFPPPILYVDGPFDDPTFSAGCERPYRAVGW